MKYVIVVHEPRLGDHTVEVRASNEAQARHLALDEARKDARRAGYRGRLDVSVKSVKTR